MTGTEALVLFGALGVIASILVLMIVLGERWEREQ